MGKDRQSSIEEARALLDWHLAMGVDEALSETGVDRFALSAAEAKPEPRPGPASTTVAPRLGEPGTIPANDTIASAREIARNTSSLDELRLALERFEGCGLKATANRLVFADGVPGSRVMFVGEAPGRDEDIQGKPFVGRAGQLLDRMLAAIELDRRQVYIANIVPWRPPGNRTPTPQEVSVCLPFIARQIALAAPDMLVFLGGASAAALTGAKEGILKLRGRWLTYQAEGRVIRALPTLHPAYLLRNPLAKRLAWRDFLALKQALG